MSIVETIATYDRIAARYAERWQDRRVMELAIKRFMQSLPADAMVLDAGCGPGFDCYTLRSQGVHVLGLDLSRGMLAEARRRYPGFYVRADMRLLPLSGGFDGVWCNASLLHLARHDAMQALREFHRVLKSGGILYLALKEGQGERQRSDAYGSDAPRYFTYWQDTELDQALRECGFLALEGWTDGSAEQRWLCRLLSK